MKKPIKIEIPFLSYSNAYSNIINNLLRLSQKQLGAVAKQLGTPIKKYKYETASAAAFHIQSKAHTYTITIPQ